MTTLPASVFGLKDRGVLRTGALADILIFDPTKVRDAATYLEPHQMSEGIDYTIVNGILVRDAGTFTGELPGRVVTPDRR
jgi:N-acyl-D-aspartate/D-glutamate deacylase